MNMVTLNRIDRSRRLILSAYRSLLHLSTAFVGRPRVPKPPPVAIAVGVAYSCLMRSFAISTLLLLAGCDAWPTVIDNRTDKQIVIQWFHRDYDHWSAPFPIRAGLATRLARAHWIQDIVGIRIKDNRRVYSLSNADLRRLDKACESSELSRRYGTASDCYLIYLGTGRVRLTAQAPPNIAYEQLGNGSRSD